MYYSRAQSSPPTGLAQQVVLQTSTQSSEKTIVQKLAWFAYVIAASLKGWSRMTHKYRGSTEEFLQVVLFESGDLCKVRY